MEILILVLNVCIIITLFFLLIKMLKKDRSPGVNQDVEKVMNELNAGMNQLRDALQRIEGNLREDFRINREENARIAKENRTELNASLKEFSKEQKEKFDEFKTEQKELKDQSLEQLSKVNATLEEKISAMNKQVQDDGVRLRDALAVSFKGFQETFDKNVKSFNDLQREKFDQLEVRQNNLVQSTEKRLDQMRETVEEKLQKTLNERLGQSFKTVGEQLEAVQKGLGEMQVLAKDVGGLKKVLSNVKHRGGLGEIQLEMLLEQILAPEQYEANVATKVGSGERVEFAIKLPGRDDSYSVVYLPIDAKFPKDAYEQLVDAYESADPLSIEVANKNIESVIRKMAKDIRDKYLDPPNTTDFGVMFLPFEGIYAEVIRRSQLMEQLHREYNIIVTGPTTLAAILNSLQMGFRTLALQKRSSEVWSILGAVKTEFGKFGDMLEKAKKNIDQAGNNIDTLIGTRTNAINRKLRDVESLPADESRKILPDLNLPDESEE